jgi:hypothetical protein
MQQVAQVKAQVAVQQIEVTVDLVMVVQVL